jgi:hypothetical protein
MQNFISFVNEHLRWEEESPHRHDCHGPPHAAGVGFHDDRSPPRRLAGAARSDPRKIKPAQVGFPGDATLRRRLPWLAGSDRWNTGRGKDCQRRYPRGEDCHPEQGTFALAALDTAKIELECFAFACEPKGYSGSHGD